MYFVRHFLLEVKLAYSLFAIMWCTPYLNNRITAYKLFLFLSPWFSYLFKLQMLQWISLNGIQTLWIIATDYVIIQGGDLVALSICYLHTIYTAPHMNRKSLEVCFRINIIKHLIYFSKKQINWNFCAFDVQPNLQYLVTSFLPTWEIICLVQFSLSVTNTDIFGIKAIMSLKN